MYEYGNWEKGRAVSFPGIHNSNLLFFVRVMGCMGRVCNIVSWVLLHNGGFCNGAASQNVVCIIQAMCNIMIFLSPVLYDKR